MVWLIGTAVAPLAGTGRLTVGAIVSRVAPVGKLQLKSAGSVLPARSLAAVVIVAVYVVRGNRAAGIGNLISLESRVTAAVRANSRPSTVAPVVTVMEAKARMFPLNTEPVPKVAELPTCQKTLAALAPPLKITWRPDVVVSVEPIWKMNTAFASPWASSGRSPEEIASEEVEL